MVKTDSSILRFVFLMILSAASLLCLAQELKVEIEAPKKINLGDTFRVKYIVSSASDISSKVKTIEVGSIKGCELLYGPARVQSTSVRIEGKKQTEMMSIADVYTMQAVKEGKYTIPSVEVTIDGKKYKSNSFGFEIVVASKDKNRRILFSDENKENQDAYIKTIVSRNRVGTRDTFMVVYRLYTTLQVNDIIDANYPSLQKDFYSHDVTPRYVLFKNDMVRGKQYTTIDIRTVILQPKSEGLKKIPGGDVEIEFTIPTGEKVKTYTGEVEVLKKEKRRLRFDGVVIEVMDLIGA